ncbi:SPARC-like protein 1 [Megalops cyprinoides]|uniref:SPARC-like protein 1 n=1 Tax=Megalops cyprinoides TaxID=118141 RepID=UPI0018650E99|nr:SPARC-like protein 1 [Megalops cyprinoides]
MKPHFLILSLLVSAFVVSVRSKPHGKHHISSKTSVSLQEKEGDPEASNEEPVLPTSITFEASSLEQEDADANYEDSDGPTKEVFGASEQDEKSAPVLLSEQALADLLEESEEEDQSEEAREEQEQEEKAVMDEGSEDSDMQESNTSTESEIPTDMDYAGDNDGQDQMEEEVKPLTDESSDLLPADGNQAGDEIPESSDYESQEESKEEDAGSREERDQEPLAEGKGQGEMVEASQGENEKGGADDVQEAKNSVELGGDVGDTEEEGGGQGKGKTRKQKKIQRVNKAPEASDETRADEGQVHLQKSDPEKDTDSADNTVHKSRKRKTGKWAPLVGMNPVQIRATEELYPRDSPPQDEGTQETPANPCENFRCKRGKACRVNEENQPECVCQDPATCVHSVTDTEHVCGTDNKTYDTSCELFATKCNLEGTKRGHRLHLDYTGPCKYIAPCLDGELVQFPLRMRDWLKNVLLQLYENDSPAHGFLTPKQRIRVQKIYESERRLHPGDHPIEMLARDFEKNYNMYIYPVHWQFTQMDQHPADRFLSHSELAPLRVPLVPMEHCTSRFFQECDGDKDKQVSFREWAHCFGIKDEDMDLNLLF